MKAFHEDKLVAKLAEIIALECGIIPAKAKQIGIAAMLHDIGKQKISPKLLNKPGKLTAEEFEQMKSHTTIGAEMLNSIQGELGVMVRTIAEFHHEKRDGSGYWGKRLCELPPYVEIVALADIFTALACVRPYKKSWPPEEVLAYIENLSDTHFSPALVEMFISLVLNDSRVAAVFKEGGGCHSRGY